MKVSSGFWAVLFCFGLSTLTIAQPSGHDGPDLTGRGDNRAFVPSSHSGEISSFDGAHRQRPAASTESSKGGTRMLGIVIAVCAIGGAAALFLKVRPSVQR